MVDRREIGNIQFYLGIFLLLVTIVGSFVVIRFSLISFVDGVSSETGTWGEVSDRVSEGSAESAIIEGIVVSELVTQGLVMKTAGFLFGTMVLILFVLSVMLVLQGLANQSKR